MKQVHGVPALLSLFFPGLGQLAKRDYKGAAIIWFLVFGPWTVWFIVTLILIPEVSGSILYAPEKFLQTLFAEFRSPLLPFLLLWNLIVQLWSVVDAYNRPVQ